MAAEMIVFHTMEDPRLLGHHSSGAALLEGRVFQEARHADPWAQVTSSKLINASLLVRLKHSHARTFKL